MDKSKPIHVKIISAFLAALFSFTELSFAAPAGSSVAQNIPSSALILKDASRFEAPLDFSSLKEIYQGENGKLIIHIQDAHSNLSGQENLAKTLDAIMTKYNVSLVLSEGGQGDCSLTPIKKIASPEVWKRLAKSYLMQGKLSGEEYLNLTSDRPMKIMGLETMELYLKSVQNYALLADKREEVSAYLKQIQAAVGKLKNKFYPEELLRYERVGSAGENFDSLLELAQGEKINLDDYPAILKLVELKLQEKLIDFNLANLEQAALFEELAKKGGGEDLKEELAKAAEMKNSKASLLATFQNTFDNAKKNNILLSAYPNLLQYEEYLKDFSRLDLDTLLDEFGSVENKIYTAFLSNDDARTVRAIDRYVGLLRTAHNIQMTTKEFDLFKINEPDFTTPAYLGFINRKLAELGYFEDIISYGSSLEDGKKALESFYDSVRERDFSFVANAEKILAAEKQKVAVLISGGYHTPHLKKLFVEKGYSMVVLQPIVTSETNQDKYEKLLLSSVNKQSKRVETIQGESKKDRSLSALGKEFSKKDGVRVLEALEGFKLNPQGSRLAALVNEAAGEPKIAQDVLKQLSVSLGSRLTESSAQRSIDLKDSGEINEKYWQQFSQQDRDEILRLLRTNPSTSESNQRSFVYFLKTPVQIGGLVYKSLQIKGFYPKEGQELVLHEGSGAAQFHLFGKNAISPEGAMYADLAKAEYETTLELFESTERSKEFSVKAPVMWGTFNKIYFQGNEVGFAVLAVPENYEKRLDMRDYKKTADLMSVVYYAGRALASLHAENTGHGFYHPGNVSMSPSFASGSWVDSVRKKWDAYTGKPAVIIHDLDHAFKIKEKARELGTDDDTARRIDLYYALFQLENLIDRLPISNADIRNFLKADQKDKEKFRSLVEAAEKTGKKARKIFVKGYVDGRSPSSEGLWKADTYWQDFLGFRAWITETSRQFTDIEFTNRSIYELYVDYKNSGSRLSDNQSSNIREIPAIGGFLIETTRQEAVKTFLDYAKSKNIPVKDLLIDIEYPDDQRMRIAAAPRILPNHQLNYHKIIAREAGFENYATATFKESSKEVVILANEMSPEKRVWATNQTAEFVYGILKAIDPANADSFTVLTLDKIYGSSQNTFLLKNFITPGSRLPDRQAGLADLVLFREKVIAAREYRIESLLKIMNDGPPENAKEAESMVNEEKDMNEAIRKAESNLAKAVSDSIESSASLSGAEAKKIISETFGQLDKFPLTNPEGLMKALVMRLIIDPIVGSDRSYHSNFEISYLPDGENHKADIAFSFNGQTRQVAEMRVKGILIGKKLSESNEDTISITTHLTKEEDPLPILERIIARTDFKAGSRLSESDYKSFVERHGIALIGKKALLKNVPADTDWAMNERRENISRPVSIEMGMKKLSDAPLVFERKDAALLNSGFRHGNIYLNAIQESGKADLTPVAVKIYGSQVREAEKQNALISAQAMDALGVGPRFYGVVRDSDGNITGYAMQVVVGEEVGYNNSIVETREQIKERIDIFQAMDEFGFSGVPDFMLTKAGHIVAVDADNVSFDSSKSGSQLASKKADEASQILYSMVSSMRDESENNLKDPDKTGAIYQIGQSEIYFTDAPYDVMGALYNRAAMNIEHNPEAIPTNEATKKFYEEYMFEKKKTAKEPTKEPELTPTNAYYGAYGHDFRALKYAQVFKKVVEVYGLKKEDFNPYEESMIQFMESKGWMIPNTAGSWDLATGLEKIALIAVPRNLDDARKNTDPDKGTRKDKKFDKDTILHEFGHAFHFTNPKVETLAQTWYADIAETNKPLYDFMINFLKDAGYEIDDNLDLRDTETIAYLMNPPSVLFDIQRFGLELVTEDQYQALESEMNKFQEAIWEAIGEVRAESFKKVGEIKSSGSRLAYLDTLTRGLRDAEGQVVLLTYEKNGQPFFVIGALKGVIQQGKTLEEAVFKLSFRAPADADTPLGHENLVQYSIKALEDPTVIKSLEIDQNYFSSESQDESFQSALVGKIANSTGSTLTLKDATGKEKSFPLPIPGIFYSASLNKITVSPDRNSAQTHGFIGPVTLSVHAAGSRLSKADRVNDFNDYIIRPNAEGRVANPLLDKNTADNLENQLRAPLNGVKESSGKILYHGTRIDVSESAQGWRPSLQNLFDGNGIRVGAADAKTKRTFYFSEDDPVFAATYGFPSRQKVEIDRQPYIAALFEISEEGLSSGAMLRFMHRMRSRMGLYFLSRTMPAIPDSAIRRIFFFNPKTGLYEKVTDKILARGAGTRLTISEEVRERIEMWKDFKPSAEVLYPSRKSKYSPDDLAAILADGSEKSTALVTYPKEGYASPFLDELIRLAKEKEFTVLTSHTFDVKKNTYIVSRNESTAHEIKALFDEYKNKKADANFHRKLGQLLGYPESEIEKYLEDKKPGPPTRPAGSRLSAQWMDLAEVFASNIDMLEQLERYLNRFKRTIAQAPFRSAIEIDLNSFHHLFKDVELIRIAGKTTGSDKRLVDPASRRLEKALDELIKISRTVTIPDYPDFKDSLKALIDNPKDFKPDFNLRTQYTLWNWAHDLETLEAPRLTQRMQMDFENDRTGAEKVLIELSQLITGELMNLNLTSLSGTDAEKSILYKLSDENPQELSESEQGVVSAIRKRSAHKLIEAIDLLSANTLLEINKMAAVKDLRQFNQDGSRLARDSFENRIKEYERALDLKEERAPAIRLYLQMNYRDLFEKYEKLLEVKAKYPELNHIEMSVHEMLETVRAYRQADPQAQIPLSKDTAQISLRNAVTQSARTDVRMLRRSGSVTAIDEKRVVDEAAELYGLFVNTSDTAWFANILKKILLADAKGFEPVDDGSRLSADVRAEDFAAYAEKRFGGQPEWLDLFGKYANKTIIENILKSDGTFLLDLRGIKSYGELQDKLGAFAHAVKSQTERSDNVDMAFFISELLANAFVHGNGTDFTLPVAIHFDRNTKGNIEKITVLDTGTERKLDENILAVLKAAELSGKKEFLPNVTMRGWSWNYQKETIAEGVVVGVAVLKPITALAAEPDSTSKDKFLTDGARFAKKEIVGKDFENLSANEQNILEKLAVLAKKVFLMDAKPFEVNFRDRSGWTYLSVAPGETGDGSLNISFSSGARIEVSAERVREIEDQQSLASTYRRSEGLASDSDQDEEPAVKEAIRQRDSLNRLVSQYLARFISAAGESGILNNSKPVILRYMAEDYFKNGFPTEAYSRFKQNFEAVKALHGGNVYVQFMTREGHQFLEWSDAVDEALLKEAQVVLLGEPDQDNVRYAGEIQARFVAVKGGEQKYPLFADQAIMGVAIVSGRLVAENGKVVANLNQLEKLLQSIQTLLPVDNRILFKQKPLDFLDAILSPTTGKIGLLSIIAIPRIAVLNFNQILKAFGATLTAVGSAA